MELCPCGSEREFEQCCGLYLSGKQVAPTATALMRSRYTAFVKNDQAYISRTWHAKSRPENVSDNGASAREVEWIGLEVLASEAGSADDNKGMVEFIARYRVNGVVGSMREISRFCKEEGNWFYLDGQCVEMPGESRDFKKVGRNDPCICGSGKKYKKCCGS